MNLIRRMAAVSLAAAAGALLFPRLPSAGWGAQAAAPPPQVPVEPQPIYERLQGLMGDAMMPNYRAAVTACAHDDRKSLRRALLNISQLAGRIDQYAPPRNAAYLEHYTQHMREVRVESAALSAGAAQASLATISEGVRRLGGGCRSCHEDYAPEKQQPATEPTP